MEIPWKPKENHAFIKGDIQRHLEGLIKLSDNFLSNDLHSWNTLPRHVENI